MTQPTLMQQSRAKVSDIIIGDRLRPLSEAGVESLIASIKETGVMKDAIHIRKKKDGKLVLIAGGHRLEAANRLGWEEIEAKIWTDVTDDWARLMEVDDNLAGAEMNALDTAVFLAERKRLYERLHPETRAGVAGGLARQGSASELGSFAAVTAEKFGMTVRQIQKIAAAGTALSRDEVRHLRAAKAPVTLKDLTEISRITDAGWTVADGLATHTAGAADTIGQDFAAESGKFYRLAFTVTGRTAGSVTPRLAGGSVRLGQTVFAGGEHLDRIQAVSGNNRLEFLASTDFDGSITGVVAYLETAACLSQGAHFIWLEPQTSEGVPGPVSGSFPTTVV